jgi:hypothetical protein
LYKIIIDLAYQNPKADSDKGVQGSKRITLTGTPGIGKSSFLIYFLVRYMYESTLSPGSSKSPTCASQDYKGHVVILQPRKSRNIFYAFGGQGIIRKGTDSDFEAYFLLPSTLYLVDWKPLTGIYDVNATTVFALSPNGLKDPDYADFEKRDPTKYCMPVWTQDELEMCRRNVFPELPEDSLCRIYRKIGGVPRYCLEIPIRAILRGDDVEEAEKQGCQRTEDALSEVKNYLAILYAHNTGSNHIKTSGRLLHRVPKEETYRLSEHRI